VIREDAVLFGGDARLVGVVTEPDPARSRPSRPAVILLNAGLLHRVGPNRIYVKLARALAGRGSVVLRFDFSNIGDSPPRPDGLPFEQSTIRETQAAMDFLGASRGRQRFLLIGSCAGANHALRVAQDEPRVVGLGLVDTYAWPTAAYDLYRYARRLSRPASWWNLLTGQSQLWQTLARRVRRPAGEGPTEGVVPVRAREQPPVSTVVASLLSVVRAGVSVCLLYSGGGPAYFHYRTRLARPLKRVRASGRVRVRAFPEADHVFTPLAAQATLVTTLCEWAESISDATGDRTADSAGPPAAGARAGRH
jgi:hypothetical protein